MHILHVPIQVSLPTQRFMAKRTHRFLATVTTTSSSRLFLARSNIADLRLAQWLWYLLLVGDVGLTDYWVVVVVLRVVVLVVVGFLFGLAQTALFRW